MRLSAGRQWAKDSAESAGFLTLWPTKGRADSPPKACRYLAATAPLSCRFCVGICSAGITSIIPFSIVQSLGREMLWSPTIRAALRRITGRTAVLLQQHALPQGQYGRRRADRPHRRTGRNRDRDRGAARNRVPSCACQNSRPRGDDQERLAAGCPLARREVDRSPGCSNTMRPSRRGNVPPRFATSEGARLMRTAAALVGVAILFALSAVPSIGLEQSCGAVSCEPYREMEQQHRQEEQRRLDELQERVGRMLDKARKLPGRSVELQRRLDEMQHRRDEMQRTPPPPPIVVNPILRRTERLN